MATDVEKEPRLRLLDAADALMYEQGYEAVGVADLCRVADVRKGSFYHFFGSKQELAIEMLDRSWDRARSTLFASSVGNQELSVFEAFDTYGELLAKNLERVSPDGEAVLGCRFGNFAVELSVRNEEVRAKAEEIFAEMTELFAHAIEQGVAAGDVADTTDPAEAAVDILVHMEGLMVLAKARQEPDLLRRLGRSVRQLLVA